MVETAVIAADGVDWRCSQIFKYSNTKVVFECCWHYSDA